MWRWVFVLSMLLVISGCASRKNPFNEWFASEKYEDYVPKTAQPMVQGKGVLSFTAPERGTVYVLDATDIVVIKQSSHPHLLGSGFAMKGDNVSFDPATGVVSSNGKTNFKIQGVKPDHLHELRFDPVVREEEK